MQHHTSQIFCCRLIFFLLFLFCLFCLLGCFHLFRATAHFFLRDSAANGFAWVVYFYFHSPGAKVISGYFHPRTPASQSARTEKGAMKTVVTETHRDDFSHQAVFLWGTIASRQKKV